MSLNGFRLLMTALVVVFFVQGCATVPPPPTNVAQRPENAQPLRQKEEDEYEGWLFKSATGRGPTPNSGASSPAPPAATAGVQPASYTAPPTAVTDPAPATTPTKSEEGDGFSIDDLTPGKIQETMRRATGNGPDESIARNHLKQGEALFAQKKYGEAAEQLEEAAKRWPDSALEEDALFLGAECLFFTDKYPKAQDAYAELLKKYDNSRHLDTICRRLFAIGRYWEEMYVKEPHWPITPNLTDGTRPRFDTLGQAMKAYEIVRMKDPTGPLADDSIMATANILFRQQKYEDAAFYYNLLRKEYSTSQHQAKAHLLGLQSQLQSYQGSLYDAQRLHDAEEIADQALTQFRGELGTEEGRVAQVRDEIEKKKAERDWTMAQFYEKKKLYGAARFYYESLIKEFPLSEYAVKARNRMTEIANEPDEPPNRFKWLTDLFPEHE